MALLHLAGPQFQKTLGLCSEMSQNGARQCLLHVLDVLLQIKDEYVFMPNRREMYNTSVELEDKFHLPGILCKHMYSYRCQGFYLGIDGCHMVFTQRPRGLPEAMDSNLFWCRKQKFSINCMVLGFFLNENYLMCHRSHVIPPGYVMWMSAGQALFMMLVFISKFH